MASYCGKCGTELSPDKQFCASCGAPVAAGFAPVAPVASYSPVPSAPPPAAGFGTVAPAPPAVQPVAAGGSTVKIVLIVVGVIVLLGILAVAAVGSLARATMPR
jgi:uncharacterized OB-fold protein